MKTKSEKVLPKIEAAGSVHEQFVRCGKANCKCASGDLHGPYYYFFHRVNRKLKKHYLKSHEIEPTARECRERRRLNQERSSQSQISWDYLRRIREALRNQFPELIPLIDKATKETLE